MAAAAAAAPPASRGPGADPPAARAAPKLAYIADALTQLLAQDGLVITARGLGAERLLFELVRHFSSPRHLVIVLNVPAAEQAFVNQQLAYENVPCSLRAVTTVFSAEQRRELYVAGGCLCVTSRILTVDLLNRLLPADMISGMLVYNAQRITDASGEAFALRLFRDGNKRGFIKALSDCPEAFTRGYSALERVMRCLFVRHVFLWPRFHMRVTDTMAPRGADGTARRLAVEELRQPLTESMRQIQSALVECMDACVMEVKRENKIDFGPALTVENALPGAFDWMVRRELDPIWHRVSPRSKQLINDMATIRRLLHCLLSYDCVTFYRFLLTIRSQAHDQRALWISTKAAQRLFEVAKARVYSIEWPQQARWGVAGARTAAADAILDAQLHVTLEPNPNCVTISLLVAAQCSLKAGAGCSSPCVWTSGRAT